MKASELMTDMLTIIAQVLRAKRRWRTLYQGFGILRGDFKEKILEEDIVEKLKDRIALSSGLVCHASTKKPSTVLKAMCLSDADAMSSIRLSVGKDNSFSEIEDASKIMVGCVKGLLVR